MKAVMLKTLLTLLVLLAATGTAYGEEGEEKFELSDWTIVDRIDPPYGPGVVKTWSVFTAKDGEDRIIFYMLFTSGTKPMPMIGQVCDLKGKFGVVDELVGTESNRIERGRIVRQSQCK